MNDQRCLIHGNVLRFDKRSGFEICEDCEKQKATESSDDITQAEALLAAIEQIRRYASGEEEIGDGEGEHEVLVRIDDICKSVLPVKREYEVK